MSGSGSVPRGAEGAAEKPRASVVVCVYNRERQIGACLASLLAQTYRPLEVVAVDDGSTDGSRAVLAGFAAEHPELPLVVVANAGNLGVSGARNAGIAAARGELVLFTDSDCRAEPGWVAAHVAALAEPAIAASAGAVIDAAPRNLAERAYAGTCRLGGGALQGRPLVGNNMAFRRSVLARHLFDEALAYGCDEDELAWRLAAGGHRFAFVAAAVVRHDHALTLAGYLRMAARQGTGSARFWYKKGTWLGRDTLLAAGALLALPLLAAPWPFRLLPLVLVPLHLAALAWAEVRFKGKSPAVALAVLPVQVLHSAVKLGSVAVTLGRLVLGGEERIRRSKAAWRRQCAGQGNGGG